MDELDEPSQWADLVNPCDVEHVYSRFCKAFRSSGWRDRVLTRLEWPEFEVVTSEVLAAPLISSAPTLYLVAEIGPQIWEGQGSRLATYFARPGAIGDLYLTDSSFSWCLAKTHDDQFWLFDPRKLFSRQSQMS